MNPFIRNIQVEISSLPEREVTDQLPMYIFKADGTQNNYRIKFDIHKHKITTATPTMVQIYNLSKETRDAISKPELKIVIKAGWENTGLFTLFQGSIMNAVTHRSGPDLITDVYSLAAGGTLGDTVISKTWNEFTTIENAIRDIVGEFRGIETVEINVKDVSFGGQGFSFAGSACNCLDKLARRYGFSWHVNSRLFVAIDDERTRAGIKAYISYKNGYLLRAEPMLATPWQKQVGVSVASYLHPQLEPGGKLELETQLNDKLNGDYVIHRLQHTGDSHGQEWKSFVESWIVVQ